MVLLNSQFRTKWRALIRNARAEKIRVVKLDPGLYYVARRAKGHGRYLVSVQETSSGIFANCRQIYGASCQSYGCCTHVAAVFERMVNDGQRALKGQRAA